MVVNNLKFSKHASKRMKQRAIGEDDIKLILLYGSQIDDAVYFLSNKDADTEIRRHKLEIQTLERLRNKKVVLANDTIVTCYHSHRKNQRQTLRKEREYL